MHRAGENDSVETYLFTSMATDPFEQYYPSSGFCGNWFTKTILSYAKSKKDRQCNGNGLNRKDKGTNNDLQNITQKTKDRTP